MVAAALTTGFLAIDVAFFSANLLKVTDGVGSRSPSARRDRLHALLVRGTSPSGRQDGRGNLPIERFIGSIALHPQKAWRAPASTCSPSPVTPPALLANLRNNGVLHETIVLVSVQTATSPRPSCGRATVHPSARASSRWSSSSGTWRVDVPEALAGIGVADFGFDPTDAVYILGKETVVVPGSWRRLHLRLFALMHRNAVDAARYFKLPPEDVLEVGVQVEL